MGLVEIGSDLSQALLAAPHKKAGFSPLTLLWVIKNPPVEKLSTSSGMNAQEIVEALRQRDVLLERIARLTVGEF